MAPDRGQIATGRTVTYEAVTSDRPMASSSTSAIPSTSNSWHAPAAASLPSMSTSTSGTTRDDRARQFLAQNASADTNFTIRGILVGLAIGIIICFSNTYFGLQTGWVSGMAMPASLMGFAFFKAISRSLAYPFTPVENVLVQTVAGAAGTMPLGAGFVGVMPALNFLLGDGDGEEGPIILGLWKLMFWALGIAFFGVFVAVPLRREVIIREKLRFPSGTATALMIRVLHEKEEDGEEREVEDAEEAPLERTRSETGLSNNGNLNVNVANAGVAQKAFPLDDERGDWRARIRLLLLAFGVSAVYTLTSYFIPQLRALPIFGMPLANDWEWALNPSPAYIGQGVIMGPATSFHMLFGALFGWAILSPLAKSRGWAPGPVGDWETGSKGWIVWVSLAIMLADSIVSLGWLVMRPTIYYGPQFAADLYAGAIKGSFAGILRPQKDDYAPLTSSLDGDSGTANPGNSARSLSRQNTADITTEPDAPPEYLPSNWIVYPGFALSIVLCVITVHITFPDIMPLWASILAVMFSLVLSLMGVRALGETDLNPVSGISKLTQLVFAFLTPASPHAITINLIAGALSESAALQAGDMMQDLKAGHLIGASPRAQFYGQLIGSGIGALAAAVIYKLYTSVYTIPSSLFQVPTAYVWIFTARLVTGDGLPPAASIWAAALGAVWCCMTALRIWGRGSRWVAWVPGGVAVAVGMFNVPSFTLARAVGGAISAYWIGWIGKEETPVVVLASGLILGEGVVSIVNLGLASLGVLHL